MILKFSQVTLHKFLFLASKLLEFVKSRVEMLMQHFQRERNSDEVNIAHATFQRAMIDDSERTFRPRNVSIDFDWGVSEPSAKTKTFNWIPEITKTQKFSVVDLSCLVSRAVFGSQRWKLFLIKCLVCIVLSWSRKKIKRNWSWM